MESNVAKHGIVLEGYNGRATDTRAVKEYFDLSFG